MKDFIVYNASGMILRAGSCAEDSYLMQAGTGELVMEGEANDALQHIVNGQVVDKPIPPPQAYDLNAAQAIKSQEIANARQIANVTSFTYAGREYSATQTAQNDLNAIANYCSLFNTLPVSFPNRWMDIDGMALYIEDVAAFKALYSAMVAQGSANFIKMQTLMYAISQATNQAELELIQW